MRSALVFVCANSALMTWEKLHPYSAKGFGRFKLTRSSRRSTCGTVYFPIRVPSSGDASDDAWKTCHVISSQVFFRRTGLGRTLASCYPDMDRYRLRQRQQHKTAQSAVSSVGQRQENLCLLTPVIRKPVPAVCSFTLLGLRNLCVPLASLRFFGWARN